MDDLADGFPDGFPSVVWPFGFTAEQEGDIGRIIATDGRVFETGEQLALVGTFVDERFFVCSIDGMNYF